MNQSVRRFSPKILMTLALLPTPAVAAAPVPAYDTAAIRAEFDRQCAAGEFSGVVVVRARGREVFQAVCGQADIVNGIANTRATRFKIYSTSKFITALTVLKLVETGKMRLDQPIGRYIAEVPAEWATVTVRQLLNHTSGIGDLTGQLVYHFRSDHPAAMRGALAALTPAEKALKTVPGATFAYNNFGFELLADAAAKAGGQPFAMLVDTLVFKPAGMKSASIEAPNIEMGHLVAVTEDGLAKGYNGAPGKLEQANNWAFVQLGAGAIRASVDDFVALDDALKAGAIVSRASLVTMVDRPVPGSPPVPGRSFGLGVVLDAIDGVPVQGHTGGTNGYISDFERYPEDDAMTIVLANRGFAKTRWLRDGVAAMLKAARLPATSRNAPRRPAT